MAWRTLRRYLRSLDKDGDVLRIKRPVKVELEAGCIADLLVKTGGPAVVFEKPELSDEFLKQEFKYIADKLDLTVDQLQKIFDGKNKTFHDYKTKIKLIKVGAKILTMLGVEKRLFR